MNSIIQSVFRHRKIDCDKLIGYGFTMQDGRLVYETEMADSQMSLSIYVSADGKIDTAVTDLETGEPFTLFLADDAVGAFLGQMRTEYESILADIASKCCKKEIFKADDTKAIINYVRDTYGDELEFLWEKTPDAAIWRRKDNSKWYGVIIAIPKRRLGADSDEMIEIVDVRVNPEEIDSIVDNKGYYLGYHMNKKHWITICLDNSLDINEICRCIDDSYRLAKKK